MTYDREIFKYRHSIQVEYKPGQGSPCRVMWVDWGTGKPSQGFCFFHATYEAAVIKAADLVREDARIESAKVFRHTKEEVFCAHPDNNGGYTEKEPNQDKGLMS